MKGSTSDIGRSSSSLIAAQLEYLKNELEKSKNYDYIIVAGHHPIVSNGSHGPTKELIKHIYPLLKKYDVNLYLSGHDHQLQELRTHHNSERKGGQRTTMYHVISGQGGRVKCTNKHNEQEISWLLPEGDSCDAEYFHCGDYDHAGWVQLSIDKKHLKVIFKDTKEGTVRRTFIEKRSSLK